MRTDKIHPKSSIAHPQGDRDISAQKLLGMDLTFRDSVKRLEKLIDLHFASQSKVCTTRHERSILKIW
jgi:hypothetical protein